MATARPAGPVRALDERVPMRDGTLLATDVVLREDGGPRPAMLYRTPYFRGSARAAADVVALARDGWAVVVQDVRGRGDSQGAFEPFVQERGDGADTIGWITRQPWCDGRVAMAGGSYLGFAQWLAALERPRGLRVIAPVTAGDGFDRGFVYEDRAFHLALALPWSLGMAAASAVDDPDAMRRVLAMAGDWDSTFATPHPEQPVRELFPAYREWLERSEPAWWRRADLTRSYRRVEVPAFHVAGWFDPFVDAGIRTYRGLREQAGTEYAREGQRLVIGPWTHTGVYLERTTEMDYGLSANGLVDGLVTGMLAWQRAAVDGEPLENGVRVFVMGADEWREYGDWPPPATDTPLFLDAATGANSLRGDGRLVWSPPAAGRDRFLYDPARPVPTRGGRLHGPLLPPSGPVDQRAVEERDDVLVYTSDVLAADLTVVGEVRAVIHLASTGRSADVTAKLVDVHPDGRAMSVLDSVRRVDLRPGVAKQVEVVLGSVAQVFRAGHRVRLEVSSSNFPRFDRNPSTGEPAAGATAYEPAVQSVLRGGNRPSRLMLPVA